MVLQADLHQDRHCVHCDSLGSIFITLMPKVSNLSKILDLQHEPLPRGLCAAKVLKFSQRKANILMFEIGPK